MSTTRLPHDERAQPISTGRTATSGGRHDGSLAWTVALSVSVCLLAFLWKTPINHDTAWYLVATAAWLDGAVLYEDIVEVNPPLNFYLTAPAVLLSDLSGTSLPQAQFAVISALLAGVLGWCWRLLPGHDPARRMLLLLALASALTLPFLVSVAQREHVMILLMAPWVIGKLSDTPNGEAGRAALAAIGLCLKPFFMLYPIALTLHEMATNRSWRPVFSRANLVFLFAGTVYMAGIAILHPQYFTEILPVARHVYGAYGLDTESVLRRFGVPGLILAVPLIVAVARREGSAALGRCAVLIAAATAIYLVQWTGYRYQFFPIASFAMLGLGWMLFTPGLVLTRPIKFLTIIALALMTYKPLTRGPYSSTVTEVLSLELAFLDQGTRLMSFSTFLSAGPSLALRNDMVWTSRYPALWLVPGAVNGLARPTCKTAPADCTSLAAIEARTREDILTDLIDNRPDVLVFDYSYGYIDAPGFSWDGFLGADPRWRTILGEFELVRDARNYDIYLHRSLMER